jgi:hypothetical protein
MNRCTSAAENAMLLESVEKVFPGLSSERSEESSKLSACDRAIGFFAEPQNDWAFRPPLILPPGFLASEFITATPQIKPVRR